MDYHLSHRALAAVRTSDRKAANATITRDTAALTPTCSSHASIATSLPFKLASQKIHAFSPLIRMGASQTRLHIRSLARQMPSRHASITRGDIGPLDPVTYYDFDPEYDAHDLEEDDYDDLNDDEESYDGDGDDGDAEDEDCDSDAMDTDHGHLPIDRPLNMPIALPQLLHNVPLRFITSSIDVSPPPSEAETRVPSPPTLILYPSSESESETETECGGEHSDKEELSWADLAVYNIAEAEEHATRKVRRDAQCSRSKVLAILGPEASSAL